MSSLTDRKALQTHRAAHREYIQRKQQEEQESTWRSSKSIDLVAFNAGAEDHFIAWLEAKIKHAPGHALAAAWVIANAAFELDVSVATIKRYLQKHTADRARFASTGKSITLRKGGNRPDEGTFSPPVTDG